MKVFDFDPRALRDDYARQGWLHIRGGLTPEFLDYARDHIEQAAARDALQGEAIHGAKTQFVFGFPEDLDLRHEVHEVIAELTGLDPEALVLSERHIKAYLPDADPAPKAHKDRYASQVSVGLTIRVGEDSHVALWPEHERDNNLHLTTGLRDSLMSDEAPEQRVTAEQAVTLHDQPGDVLVFPGSSTWHLRNNSASTTLVYLKFNDFGCDPLAEDPSTPVLREQTAALLEQDDLDDLVPVLSRGFDSVSHETGREPGRETWAVNTWHDGDRTTRAVPGAFVPVLDAVGDGRPVAQLAQDGVGGLSADQVREAVRVLAERGALDLLPR